MAVWRPELQKAEVTIQRGNLMRTYGETVNGQLLLQPEEVCSLVERGKLFLIDSCGKVTSLSRCYQYVEDAGIELYIYSVYAHLRNLGFILMRHETFNTNIQSNRNLYDTAILSNVYYKVYEPNSQFSKRDPGEENFLLCILESRNDMSSKKDIEMNHAISPPSPDNSKSYISSPDKPEVNISTICSVHHVGNLIKKYSPIPVKVAVVFEGKIQFYSVQNEVTMGTYKRKRDVLGI